MRHRIVAENVTIEENAIVGEEASAADSDGEEKLIATIGPDVIVGKGARIGAKAMIEKSVKEGEMIC